MGTKSTNTNFSLSACKSNEIAVFFVKKTLNQSLSLAFLDSFLLKDSIKSHKSWYTLSRQDNENLQCSAPQSAL